MTLTFHVAPESGAASIERFLRGVFRAPEDSVFLQAAQLHWKYWQPRPDWAGSRSFIFETGDGDIAAHACAWPLTLLTPEGTITGSNPIDWAAGTQAPGAGVLLLRQVRALRDVCCCIGGTEIAQTIIRQSGFRPFCNMQYLVRPLRPWRQLLTNPRRDWRLPARYLRNLLWTMQSGIAAESDWSAEPVEPEQLDPASLPSPQPGMAVPQRSRELFRYMCSCPTARHRLWTVSRGGRPGGYFLLSFVPGQARIVDAWSVLPSVESWSRVYALAAGAALEEPDAAEIVVAAAFSEASTAALRAGFRPAYTLPVMLFDPQKRLREITRLGLQMMDNDAGFLHDSRVEYLS